MDAEFLQGLKIAWEPKFLFACSLTQPREEDQMQQKFMPTDVFLRLEKEWQHMRQAEYHLEIEAVRPSDQRLDGATELESASATQAPQRS